MRTRTGSARTTLFLLVLTLAVCWAVPTASARFFGNRPEAGGSEEEARSRELAQASLTIISQIYAGLADYESTRDPARLNGVLSGSAEKFRSLSTEYERLGRGGTDLKLSPEALVAQLPQSVDLLGYFGQKPSELNSLSNVALKMAEEESRLAESLEKVRFDGASDPETVLVLYDALERLQYLAAVYAKANQTASPSGLRNGPGTINTGSRDRGSPRCSRRSRPWRTA